MMSVHIVLAHLSVGLGNVECCGALVDDDDSTNFSMHKLREQDNHSSINDESECSSDETQ